MTNESPVTMSDCAEAVRLAEAAFPEERGEPKGFHLLRAENLLTGTKTCPGPRCWRLTFIPRDQVPESLDEELTAGGEMFFEVDLNTGKATVSGYGE